MTLSVEQVFTGAKLVLEQEVVTGTMVIRNGIIQDIQPGRTDVASAVDFAGDYLIPGLIELHTDNMEKHFVPRPGVQWPGRSAVLTHDAQIVASGITTVFDAISIGDIKDDGFRLQSLPYMLSSLQETCSLGLTRAEHFVHLRCEVSHESCMSLFEQFYQHPLLRLVSIMDHSPGQRQFTRLDKYIQYYKGKLNYDDAQMDHFITKHQMNSARYADDYRQRISHICREKSIPLASHDDATLDHVSEAVQLAMCIAEFPTTVEAAQSSHDNKLHVLMGAPNIVRGGSHSGNVAAAELAVRGALDILSSDYYPASLLEAAFKLSDMHNDYDLPRAISTVTRNPADAVGMTDRGRLQVGCRADLIRVQFKHDHPTIRYVWNQGERVY
jgi:alpha-D-ribose 1-methylphosphonate 5-triphosphate diphosphatase